MKYTYLTYLLFITCTVLPHTTADLEKQLAHRLICKDAILSQITASDIKQNGSLAPLVKTVESFTTLRPTFDKILLNCYTKEETAKLKELMTPLLQRSNKQELLSMLAANEQDALIIKQQLLTYYIAHNTKVNIGTCIVTFLGGIGCALYVRDSLADQKDIALAQTAPELLKKFNKREIIGTIARSGMVLTAAALLYTCLKQPTDLLEQSIDKSQQLINVAQAETEKLTQTTK